MSETNREDVDRLKGAGLSLKDWLLLPVIGLITILLMAASTELIARRMFAEVEKGQERCRVFRDPASGKNRLADCVYRERGLESPETEYRMNGSGFRSDVEFSPKAPGIYRIVIVGSSFGFGGGTEYAKTIAGLLPPEISARTGKKVEVYNESIPGQPGLPQNVDRRFKDALNLEPDLILWVITRWDIKEATEPMVEVEEAAGPGAMPSVSWSRFKRDFKAANYRNAALDLGSASRDQLVGVKGWLADSRSAFLLQHFMDESQSQYVKYSLSGPDDIVGYLKAQPSRAWQDRLKVFDGHAADIAAQAKGARVPLAVVLVPTRIESAMISMNEWPAGFDPYKLDEEVSSIIASHGAIYIDIAPQFRGIPNPEQLYLPVDGHPNTAGNAVISSLLSSDLTGGAVPSLNSMQPQVSAGQRRIP